MVKILSGALAYNWKYYVFSVLAFVVFWQAFSVVSAARVAEDKLATGIGQNAAYFEKAFLDGDVFETQRILWRVKNDNIKRITFNPVGFEGSKWIFREAVVGNLYDRPWAQMNRHIPLISNGAELGGLEYVIDFYDVNAAVFSQNYALFITVLLFFTALLSVSNMGAIKALLGIEKCVSEVNRLVNDRKNADVHDAVRERIEALPESLAGTPFAEMTAKMADVLQLSARLDNELAVSKAMSSLAAQVAHDIRSPLTALDAALKNTAQMPEEQRVIVRHAVNRIRDIANNLIEKNRQQVKTASAGGAAGSAPAAESSAPPEICLLSSLVDPVITEKRLQFESKPGVEIDFEPAAASYGLFAKVQPVEFKRLVSNLVNNAVEAVDTAWTQSGKLLPGFRLKDCRNDGAVSGFPLTDCGNDKGGGEAGSVKVSLSSENGKIVLIIKDDGKGIPPELLARLGRRGETHGKAGGSGLGLFHAKISVERWGGVLEIKSEAGRGTAVTIKLPAAEAPEWFVSKLALPAGKPVVVLDDDESIHRVWDGRFASVRVKEKGIEIFHFSDPDSLRGWFKNNPEKTAGAVFLFDYELLGHKETGIALAQELKLEGRAILVTSRYEEKRIIEECRRLKIRMIPKGLAGLAPITVGNRVEGRGYREETAKQVVDSTYVSGVEVLIDDDALVHMTWKMAARANGIMLKAFKSPAEFMTDIEAFPKHTPVYLDSELGGGVKGEDLAKTLHDRGFSAVCLETGHPSEDFAHLPWLKVIGKEPPWEND